MVTASPRPRKIEPVILPFDDMYRQTVKQANQIIRGQVPCPICSERPVLRPVLNCICQFYRELGVIIRRVVPEKYLFAHLASLQPSGMSRLPLSEQAALYDEMRADPLHGWAFFAPAGYSKTTCSYALWKQAVLTNLKQNWVKYPERYLVEAYEWLQRRNDGLGGQGSGSTPRTCVWRKSVPDLLQQHFDRMNMKEGEDAQYVPKPEITVEKIELAKQQGMTPRVFLDEIDKIKPSEYAINQLFRIFDALDRHKGQIVLDTNLSKAQFKKIFGEMIVRRIKENCHVREFGFGG